MTKPEIAVLKVGGRTYYAPACIHCLGAVYEVEKLCEDGFLMVKCKECGWEYGMFSGGSLAPCLQNHLIPLFDRQEKRREEIDAKIEAAKTPEERDKYLKLRSERHHLTGIEIHRAWELILERFRRGE